MTEGSSMEGRGGCVCVCGGAYVHMKVRGAVKPNRNDALQPV